MIFDVVFRTVSLIIGCMGMIFAPMELIPHVSKFILYCLGVQGDDLTSEEVQRFHTFYYGNGPAAMLYNHPSFYDYAVLSACLGMKCRFVAFSHRLLFPSNIIAKRFKSLVIKPKSGSAEAITKDISQRQKGTPVLAISPTGGRSTEDYNLYPNKLLPFSNGGILGKITCFASCYKVQQQ